MGNKVSRKLLKIEDMTLTDSRIFEIELNNIMSNKIFTVNQQFFIDVEQMITLAINKRELVNRVNILVGTAHKLYSNLSNITLNSVFKNTLKGALCGYGGLYMHDKLKNPIIYETVTSNDCEYNLRLKVAMQSSNEYIKNLYKHDILGYKAGDLLKAHNDDIYNFLASGSKDKERKNNTNEKNLIYKLLLDGIKYGFFANVAYNLLNFNSIYQNELFEMKECLNIIRNIKNNLIAK